MYIAELFTNHELGFALYLTDVAYDNFAVNRHGKVIVVDLEDILVVDKAKIKRGEMEGQTLLAYRQLTGETSMARGNGVDHHHPLAAK